MYSCVLSVYYMYNLYSIRMYSRAIVSTAYSTLASILYAQLLLPTVCGWLMALLQLRAGLRCFIKANGGLSVELTLHLILQ